ncbi:hypothetical protein Tco_0386173 [Tanacetum coccineum]
MVRTGRSEIGTHLCFRPENPPEKFFGAAEGRPAAAEGWPDNVEREGEFFEALDKRHMGEDRIISAKENVYRLVSLEPGNCDVPGLIVTIPYNLCKMIITKSDGTKKFFYKVDELRVISCHVPRASRVQVPKDDLDDLHWTREEDGEFKTADP